MFTLGIIALVLLGALDISLFHFAIVAAKDKEFESASMVAYIALVNVPAIVFISMNL